MFYLVRNIENKLYIVSHVESEEDKKQNLDKELKKNDIKLIEKEDEAESTGLYCFPLENGKYQVIRRITEKDGFLFYGKRYNIHCQTYEYVWYEHDD